MSKPIVLYGLTAFPVTKAHQQSYLWLCEQGNNTLVVPAIGHEFKLWAVKSYPVRKRNCFEVFGDAVVPLEEHVLGLGMEASVDDIQEALKRFGRSVMAIDMMRAVRELVKRPLRGSYRDLLLSDQVKPPHRNHLAGNPTFARDRLNETVATDDIRFAIGPDVDVDTWTGIEEIRAEFGADPFVRMPEIPNIRATLVREAVAAGQPWEHLVPPQTAKLVKDGVFGWGVS